MASISPAPSGSRALHRALWVAQVLTAAAFIAAGLMKALTPIPELARSIPWAGAVPPGFVRGIAVVDLAGGLGLVLPGLLRIRPHLTVWAARGCAVLQVLAAAFHLWRGEAAVVPLNIVLLALSLFVLWGRSRRAPVAARR